MSAIKKVEITTPMVPLSEGDKVLSMIDRVLSNPDLPVEKLEQMFDLYQKVQASEARKAFDAAMAGAKSEIPVIRKSRTVSHETKTGGTKSYVHEDLGGIAEIVDPILAKYGLSYRYRTSSNVNEPISVTCIIAHKQGYFEETTLSAGRDDSGNKNSLQAIGSTITYLQRYTLKAALGLAAAKDDDAKAASGDTLSEAQVDTLFDLIAETESNVGQFLIAGRAGMETVPETVDGIKEAIGNIKAKEYDRLHAQLITKKKGGSHARR